MTGHDEHPEAAVSGARIIRWHSLVRAAAPFYLGQRHFLHSSPHRPPFTRWQCDMMHFISYWEDAKLSDDTHSSQATLFNKEHGNHRYQLQRIKVAFPLQCILPYISFATFSLHLQPFFLRTALADSLKKSRVSV